MKSREIRIRAIDEKETEKHMLGLTKCRSGAVCPNHLRPTAVEAIGEYNACKKRGIPWPPKGNK
jgi:hypothetical protein